MENKKIRKGGLPPEYLAEATESYLAGTGAAELGRRYGVSLHVIRNAMLRQGLVSNYTKQLKPGRSRSPLNLTEETKAEIITKYNSGIGSFRLGNEYQISDVAVCNLVRKAGYPIRDFKLSKYRKVWHEAFKTPTEESEYWAGFLFADGCLTDYKTIRGVYLGLARKDDSHIVKFQQFLRSDHKISRRSSVIPDNKSYAKVGLKPGSIYEKTEIAIISNDIHDDLHSLGMHGDRIPHPDLVKSRHFWRGMVDGDGYVSNYPHTPAMGLLASEETLLQFKDFLWENGLYTPAKPRRREETPIFAMTWVSKNSYRIIKLLYENATIGLDRKMKTATEVITRIDCIGYSTWSR